MLHDAGHRGFLSDNASGVHPEVLAAIADANGGHTHGYGDDPYTEALRAWAKREFGESAQIFPMLTGTGSNVVALQAMSPRWGGVVCSDIAHIAVDENAAASRVGGLALIPCAAPDGRLTTHDVLRALAGPDEVHAVRATTLSLTQSTELGTAYAPDDLRDLCTLAHARGLTVHVDGARFANAAVHARAGLGELARDAGIDVLSLGATKTGALGAEAIVVLNPDAVAGVAELRKIDLQLASKHRFLSAQLLAVFGGDLWRRTATHANEMAQRLAQGLRRIPGIDVPLPVHANGVFPVLHPDTNAALHERFDFYDWPGRPGMARLMCSWDTTADEVDALCALALEHAATGFLD